MKNTKNISKKWAKKERMDVSKSLVLSLQYVLAYHPTEEQKKDIMTLSLKYTNMLELLLGVENSAREIEKHRNDIDNLLIDIAWT